MSSPAPEPKKNSDVVSSEKTSDDRAELRMPPEEADKQRRLLAALMEITGKKKIVLMG